MGLPLPPNVIPLSAATAGRVFPLLRIVPAAASVAPAAAGGGVVGALAGTALPLVASFALGYEIGTQLLRAWEALNQRLVRPGDPLPPAGPVPINGLKIPSPGYRGLQTVNFVGTRDGSVTVNQTTVNPYPYSIDVVVTSPFPFEPTLKRFEITLAGGPFGGYNLNSLSISVTYETPPPGESLADPPTNSEPIVEGPAPNQLEQADFAPLLAVPVTVPALPRLPWSDVPSLPATPAAPPAPGQPIGVPSRPTLPNRPGGQPVAPGVGPAPSTPLQPIGDPVKGPAPATVPTVDPARPPLTFPGPGTVPVAPPPLVPITDPDLIKIGNLIIGDPGERPRPDLVSISKELGRQEQKLAGLLGGLGLGSALDDLLKLLTSINGGTTYSLTPPCGTTTNGDPLPVVEVIVPPTIGDNAAVIARLDALAMLLDEHKQMRQPICKGKPTGSPVTVTAVEIE